jgi:hypothetical protein
VRALATSAIVLSALLPALSCSRGPIVPDREIGPGEAVALSVGQSATIRGSAVRLRVASIADSRCPSDVRCVWAGEGIVVLVLTGGDVDRIDTLHIGRQPAATSYGGRRIELRDLQPAPRTADDRAEKVATIAVSELP